MSTRSASRAVGWVWFGGAVASVCAMGACGSSEPSLVDTVSRDPTVAPQVVDSGTSGLGAAPVVCAPGATLVYVLDTADFLHSFDPTLVPSPTAFRTIGRLNCAEVAGGSWAGASSMAIDRGAVAWVTDRAGRLFNVSTTNASCRTTSYRLGQHGFSKVGMGFAGDATLGTEKLFVVDDFGDPTASTGLGLATIDVGSLRLTTIGDFDGALAGRGAELTGTGDGRLFGFFPDAQSSIAEIDPTTSHIVSDAPVAAPIVIAGAGEIDFAFSFWGGSFYLYTANTATAPTTDVTEFDPATGTASVVMPQIGFNIIGAGVSTCAPTTAPR